MFYVKDIQQDVMGRLDLTRRADLFSPDMFYRALNRALRILNKKFRFLRKPETISGTGIFTLDPTVRPMHILRITTPWTYPLERVSVQRMETLRHVITGEQYYPYTIHTDQPSFWAFFPTSSSTSGDDSPGSYIEMQDNSMLTTAADIEVEYSYLPIFNSRVTQRTAELDIGEEYFDVISLLVGRELASRYAPDRYGMFDKEYTEEVLNLQTAHRRRLQSNEGEHTDYIPW